MKFMFTEAQVMHGFILFLALVSMIGFFAGVLLLVRPHWFSSLNHYANRWISTRQMGRLLEKPINSEQWLYRNSFISGILLLAGALYILYIFTVYLVRVDLLHGLAKLHWIHSTLLEPLIDSLVLVLLTGALLALLVSLFLIFRPSMLREMELGANQNTSLRQMLKPVELQHGDVDEMILRHSKIFGIALICGSLYIFVTMMFFLIK